MSIFSRFSLPIILASVALLTGCPSPPDKALADAEQALREAAVVSECAEAEFAEAEAMLAEAKRLVEEGRYDEAEVKAKGAKTLATRAQQAGEANWEECQKAKNPPVDENAGDDGKNDLATLQTVFFSYNEAVLNEESQAILRNNADWLRRHPQSRVLIQGHCDERGSTEFNVALGERRAASVRKYLVQLGIDGGRLSIISFGEELPAVSGDSEDTHARNRRSEFVPQD